MQIAADMELVQQFQQGLESAFETLVRKYMRDAYAFSLRLTGRPQEAEEIAQDGFIKAHRAMGRFRGEASFRSWLFRILINLHRDRKRSSRRYEARLAILEERESRREQEVIGADRQAEELSDVVREKIDSLPGRQKEVLTLHLYQNLSYREIADIVGISYEAVKVNLSMARKRLKDDLKEYL